MVLLFHTQVVDTSPHNDEVARVAQVVGHAATIMYLSANNVHPHNEWTATRRSSLCKFHAPVWIRQIYEIHHLRNQRVAQCLVRCSLMQQHRAQLNSSTTDAKPGTGIDAARPGICSTPAAHRPGAANRTPEFSLPRGAWRARSAAGIRRATWAPTTSSAQQFRASRLQPVTSTAADDHWAPGHLRFFFDSSTSRRHVSGQHLCKTSALHAVSMISSFCLVQAEEACGLWSGSICR
jgi:hypothetical protein